MRNKILATAAAGVMLVAAAAGIAGSAGAAQTKDATFGKQFKVTLTPNKNVKPGTVLTLKSSKAMPNTAYYCVQVAFSKNISAPNESSLKAVKSNAKGKLTCKTTYKPFKGTDQTSGKKYSCPPTKAETKAGVKCGVAFADQATIGAMSAGVAPFAVKK